jgi:hypothetical protein
MSTAMFHLPNRATVAATMIHKLHYNLQEPARCVNIVLSLVGNDANPYLNLALQELFQCATNN